MVWAPRVDEKPYVISYLDEDRFAITVQQRGPFSALLCSMKGGEKLGFRGPYGSGFRGIEPLAAGSGSALIGGGCGMAGLRLLKEALPESTLVQGAQTKEDLVFLDRFPDQIVFTDDGSAGEKGLPTQWLSESVARGRLRQVYTCGPELMMFRVVDICRRGGVACQASLERYMKCGMGLCGQCECDGRRVCVEGPVFDAAELADMPSFGRVKRDKAGRAVDVAEGDGCDYQPAEAGNDIR